MGGQVSGGQDSGVKTGGDQDSGVSGQWGGQDSGDQDSEGQDSGKSGQWEVRTVGGQDSGGQEATIPRGGGGEPRPQNSSPAKGMRAKALMHWQPCDLPDEDVLCLPPVCRNKARWQAPRALARSLCCQQPSATSASEINGPVSR